MRNVGQTNCEAMIKPKRICNRNSAADAMKNG